jgi:hypothetical protein
VRPDHALVTRAAACVELRLAVERDYPDAHFASYRELAYQANERRSVPDGLMQLGNEAAAMLVIQDAHPNALWRLEERLAHVRRRHQRIAILATPAAVTRVRDIAKDAQVVPWFWRRWEVNPPHAGFLDLDEPTPDQPLARDDTAAAPTPADTGAAAATRRPEPGAARPRRRRRRGGQRHRPART